MKEGDIIKTYYKGYFRLDKIERRFKDENWESLGLRKDLEIGDEMSPLFHFTQIYDENLNKRTSKKSCDAGFCHLARVEIIKEIGELEAKVEKLRDFYNTLEK